MAGYYQGTATMDDLVSDRIDVLNRTKARLQAQKPYARQSIGANFDERIRNVRAEGLLIKALQENYPDQVALKALAEVRGQRIQGPVLDNT